MISIYKEFEQTLKFKNQHRILGFPSWDPFNGMHSISDVVGGLLCRYCCYCFLCSSCCLAATPTVLLLPLYS